MKTIHKTVGQVLDEVSSGSPRREALVHTELGVRYSYALLSWEIQRVAKALLHLGIDRGDRVGLWAPNIPEWIVSFLAVADVGGTVVPIDPGAGRDDVSYVLDQSGCRALIMSKGLDGDEYVDMILGEMGALPSLEHVVVIADASYPDTQPWSEFTAKGDAVEADRLQAARKAVRPEDPIAIMYTSGTTGKPKGVVLDHVGLINKSACSVRRQGLAGEDRLCLFFPLFHMFGNTCIALAGLLSGATLVLPCQSFDPSKVLRGISRERCTAVYGSPSMLIALVDHPEFNRKTWKGLTRGTIGGAPCPMGLMRRLVEEIGVSNVTVGYGITEASSWVTMTRPEDPIELRVSTIGLPLECCEVKIVDPRTGEPVGPGRPGELCTRGFLMKEYFRMPAATHAAIDREGWFHTGDLGEMDEKGYLRITGRLKDVIVRDGIEIHPVDIEEILYQFQEVSEVQVFGFPHAKRGQEVAAWVRLREGGGLDVERLRSHVTAHIAPEKAPSYFKIVSDFPMTRSGKVQKFKLAELALKEYT
jgi:fatty-acyl-CoA synthase